MAQFILSATFIATPFGALVGFAINMVISSIVSKIFAPNSPNTSGTQQQNVGQNQQMSPAGDNKVPVIYGSYFTGGIITDLSITNDNQNLYWVITLSEVTNSENGNTPDVFTFGDIYWGGKKVIFGTNQAVTGLQDVSTGLIQDITGYMDVWLYSNGSNTPTNSTTSAITVMQSAGLVYTWNSTKLMSNCAFAIVHIKYSQSRNLTALNQTRFQVNNPRNSAGDCLVDYLTSTRYGAAIPIANIDTASMTALNTYSNASFTYTLYSGGTATQPRFKFNGSLDTNQKIMVNIQSMADCCDCLVRYSEITSLWGVIVQTPTYTVAMDVNDSNMVSAIMVTPIDLSNTFNVIEVKFPDTSTQSNFNSASFDLAVINPSLMFPNEPVNKQSVSLILCGNSVQAQYLANRFLEAAREDLQLQVDIDYTGLQLDAGDIVTVTNANYGWVAKLFRIAKVTQKFTDSGQVTAGLGLMEYNPSVYDDVNITQFIPSPNTGIGSPSIFGVVPAPTIITPLPFAVNPAFSVQVTTSTAGITQYAEVWYSAYQFPTTAQMMLAGTTEINSNGDPYGNSVAMPPVQLFNIPAGNWYFFDRMVNSIASSNYSLASSVFNWRPTTFQYVSQYLSVAYASSITGTGFSFSPTGKTYYGLLNQTSSSPSSVATDYKWYLADLAFGTSIYLVYTNRTGRKFSFDTDFATYAAGSGAFVPSTTIKFDPRIWAALDPASTNPNIIDLDHSTGQVIETGTTTVGTGQVKIVNTNDGQVVASLDQYLDFGGAPTLTGSASTITIDIYGRVVGFTIPDDMYINTDRFTATSGQTLFTPATRGSTYITGQDLIFKNGLLLDTTDYTETHNTFTLNVGATVGDTIECISFQSESNNITYASNYINVLSVASNVVTWNSAQMPYQLIKIGDKITFSNTGSPTQYTVTGVNYVTQQITFATSVTASVGAFIYTYRAALGIYSSFSRYSTSLSSQSTYTPTTWAVDSGYELLFLNGTVVNEQDYDIVSGAITNFPSITTGLLTIIQWNWNNLGVPVGSPANVFTYTVSGQSVYPFTYDPLSFNLYANGILLNVPSDYTTATGSYSYVNTPTNNTTAVVQQTFARQGAII